MEYYKNLLTGGKRPSKNPKIDVWFNEH